MMNHTLPTEIAVYIFIALLIFSIVYMLYLYFKAKYGTQLPTSTVADSLIGKEGIVVETTAPYHTHGKVWIDNRIWSATSREIIPENTVVYVADSKGVHVIVERRSVKNE